MADKLAGAKLARAAMRFAARGRLPPLILMTDDERLTDPVAAASALPCGSMVILRARQPEHRRELAARLKPVARTQNLKLLIAGDAELAARIGADGIHLAEVDAGQAAYWRARHAHWIISVSAHSPRVLLAARHADAVLIAPVFPTASHPGGATLGAMALRAIARHSPLPVYALGGIDARTVQRLQGAKLAGIAAVGALAA